MDPRETPADRSPGERLCSKPCVTLPGKFFKLAFAAVVEEGTDPFVHGKAARNRVPFQQHLELTVEIPSLFVGVRQNPFGPCLRMN